MLNVANTPQASSLIEFLKHLAMEKATGVIIVTAQSNSGSIVMIQGEVLRAEFEDRGGISAIFRMLCLVEATFQLDECEPPSEMKNIHLSMTRVMVEMDRVSARVKTTEKVLDSLRGKVGAQLAELWSESGLLMIRAGEEHRERSLIAELIKRATMTRSLFGKCGLMDIDIVQTGRYGLVRPTLTKHFVALEFSQPPENQSKIQADLMEGSETIGELLRHFIA